MTTSLQVLDGGRAESLTEAVARRLRGQLAERRISGLGLAKLTGLGRGTIDRRLRGETALNTDELELIERKTGISAVYLLTGLRTDRSPRPEGPGEGVLLPHLDSNQKPAGLPEMRRLRRSQRIGSEPGKAAA